MVIKKSRDARLQLRVWNRLLEGRIALQKVVTAVRDLEKIRQVEQKPLSENDGPVVSIKKLLKCLVRLRETYRIKSQFCLTNQDKDKDEEQDGDRSDDDEIAMDCDDETLTKKHDDYQGIREEIISKWCEKTKIGVIPKKGYVAMELPTLQLIQNSMKEKNRLIKRTQLDRSSHQDDAYHPETFNDDDFYHNLLKEMISKAESSQWVELQRTRYKSKRKADTRATKGRKIKKDLVPKLVNFMAPMRPMNMRDKEVMPEQIRVELLKSLFGGSIQSRSVVEHEE
uniref:Protein AATF n=1 Tax=Aceria tosichella TaxID=561515 RepID=A0A6G1SC76_9ACAR